MTIISSDTLFHFTNSIQNIVNILSLEFHPNFSLEDFSSLDPPNKFKRAIPMVSFCDIPLSQTKEHMEVYGYYAIGLSKSWGQRNGVTPVLYAYQGSPLAKNIHSSFMWISPNTFDKISDSELKEKCFALWDNLFRVISYVKPYEGSFYKNSKHFEKLRFYNEREWRFIPDLVNTAFPDGMQEGEYLNLSKRSKANTEIQEKSRISFEPSDIKYIIVAHENEILPMIWQIEVIKGKKYEPDEVKLLSSRIISAEQIAIDF